MSTPTVPYRAPRLPDRYLREVQRRVPRDQRDDVVAELSATISDRVEALRQERPDLDLEAAEREALVELGDPARLAASYAGRPAQLIGPDLYPVYAHVLRAVLLMAVPAAVGVHAVLSTLGDSPGRGYVGGLVSLLLTVVVQTVFWVTAVFAAVERFAGEVRAPAWSPDDLPEGTRTSFEAAERLGVRGGWLVLVGGGIVAQQLTAPVHLDGERVPLLDPALWSSWLPLVLVGLAAALALEVEVLRSGTTGRLVLARSVADAAWAVPLAVLGATGRLFHPGLEAVDRSLGWVLVAFLVVGWVMARVAGWRELRRSRPSAEGAAPNH